MCSSRNLLALLTRQVSLSKAPEPLSLRDGVLNVCDRPADLVAPPAEWVRVEVASCYGDKWMDDSGRFGSDPGSPETGGGEGGGQRSHASTGTHDFSGLVGIPA